MLQKRKKLLTAAGTAVVLFAVSLTFAFKPVQVATAPPAPEFYWYHTGTGSITNPASYSIFAPTTIFDYMLDSFCPAGTEELCTVIAPVDPYISGRPAFDSFTVYRLNLINAGSTGYFGYGIRMKAKSN